MGPTVLSVNAPLSLSPSQVPKGVFRQRPLARTAALMGTPVFSASCASVTVSKGVSRLRRRTVAGHERTARPRGRGTPLTRTSQCVPILGTQAANPFMAKGASQAAVDFAGLGGGPGTGLGSPPARRCACAAADRPLRAGPSVRGPVCSRTPAPTPALKPPLAGLILAPATPG